MSNNVATCEITINGIPAKVNQSLTVMQACESVNIQIPHFCFHDTLGVAGNCRMCLVEVQPSTKPVPLIASCAMVVSPKMQIFTDTALVKKVREGVLEFLLSTHPLDCPICDQGGECDLQDHSLLFGSDRGRFYEAKKAVSDKQCGPLIKTVMTRCIQCTRCVRFATDVAGTPILGITGRGATMEIGFYMDRLFASELSGNIIDLCPVGALTSKPYAFTARPWELKKVPSVDPFDAINSNIEINLRGLDIMRILPKINTEINGDWIPDKVRFNFDGFLKNGVLSPECYQEASSNTMSPRVPTNHIRKHSWDFCFLQIQQHFQTAQNILHVFGSSVSFDEIAAIKFFFNRIGLEHFGSAAYCSMLRFSASRDFRHSFFCSTSLATFDQLSESSAILLINCNVKPLLPILEAKLHQAYKKGSAVFVLGTPVASTYKATHLGTDLKLLDAIAQGKHWLCAKLLGVQRVIIFCDSTLQETSDIAAPVSTLRSCLLAHKVDCVINPFTADSGSLHLQELGLRNKPKSPQRCISDQKHVQFFWQESALHAAAHKGSSVNVFVGSNAPSVAAANMNAIFLPIANCFETGHSFLNINGFRQSTAKVLATGRYHLAELLEALFLFVDSRQASAAVQRRSYFNVPEQTRLPVASGFTGPFADIASVKVDRRVMCPNFSVSARDYYTSDIISRSSKTMLTCSKVFNKQKPVSTF